MGAARYLPDWHPQGGIAQGSIFVIFGQDLGPAKLVVVNEFPVPTELAGTQVQVVAGGVTVDCPVIYTSAGQAAAIMPSNTPLGEADVFVRYNGGVSNAGRVRVVQRAPGFFTLTQTGMGAAVVTDADYAVNTMYTSFAPGKVVSFWATGLGARSHDDIAQVEDLRDRMDFRVYIGDRPAEVIYAGPSGCCAGLDQVIVRIPEETADHCFVPVVMTADGKPSNTPTISVSSDGETCEVPGMLSKQDMEAIRQGATVPFGRLDIVLAVEPRQGASGGSAGEAAQSAGNSRRLETGAESRRSVGIGLRIGGRNRPESLAKLRLCAIMLAGVPFERFVDDVLFSAAFNDLGCAVNQFYDLADFVNYCEKALKSPLSGVPPAWMVDDPLLDLPGETTPDTAVGGSFGPLVEVEGHVPRTYVRRYDVDPSDPQNQQVGLTIWDGKTDECLCSTVDTAREAGIMDGLGDDTEFVATVLEAAGPRLKAVAAEAPDYRERLRMINGMRIEGLNPDDLVFVFGSITQVDGEGKRFGTAFSCAFAGDQEIQIPDYVRSNMLESGSRKVVGIEVRTPARQRASVRAIDESGKEVQVGVDVRVGARYTVAEGQ